MGKRVSAFTGPISPNQNYVYYNHLIEENKNPVMRAFGYAVIRNFKEAFDFDATEPDMGVVDKLKTMAKNERTKEQDFLETTFGVNLQIPLSADNTKQFIDAFNSYMQLQRVYEARKILLMRGYGDDEGKQNFKDAYSYFSSYFSTVFEQNIDDIAADTAAQFKKGGTFDQALNSAIDSRMPAMIEEALTKLEHADGNQGLNDSDKEQVREALRAISDAINSFGKTQFGQMILTALNLNKINRDAIQDMKIRSQGDRKKINKKTTKQSLTNAIKYLKSNRGVHILGGTMAELVENVSAKAVLDGLKGVNNAEVFHTGSTGMAADNVMIVAEGDISLEKEKIQQILEEGKKTSRQSNIDTVKEMENILERGNTKGFIVYSSDKNYLKVRKKKDGTFYESSYKGSSQNLRLFTPILAEVTGNSGKVDVLIQGIMQTLKGAVGENNKGYMEAKLAQYFAYFLFDDLDFIGEVDGSNYQKIHLMNLNGIYVPLSAFIQLYAEALEHEYDTVKRSPEHVARISIKSPDIKYDYSAPGFKPPQNAWGIQRNEAMDQVQVTLYFLKNLRSILDDVNL